MALSYGSFNGDYAWHVFKFFKHMNTKIQTYIPSPSGLDGYVDNYLSYSDRLEASSRIETALAKSREAWLAHYNNNDKESIEKFGKLFGDRFPSYG
ncbi:hypothetical protein UB39_16070 [Photobacterium angustum]|nr:hypothetical protein UB39_16070 [Photobacterium angustum]